MHFVFRPPGEAAAGLLNLPWRLPLEYWTDERQVEIRQRGLSRHVVRFVAEGGTLYALKELHERLARREYRLLRRLTDLGLPAVEATGIVVDRGDDVDAILVTRYLDHACSYRSLFANPRGGQHPTDRLLDALVELLARLHLAGFMWGDCSLSNTLFRLDAGAFAAYLVDAETAELHSSGLSEGQRHYDVDLARERIAGELFDLAAAGLLPSEVDPVTTADAVAHRYESLWNELTREELLHPDDQQYRVAERLRRINGLGFDVDEVELLDADDGLRMRVRTRVAEPGHHRRILYARTGIDAQENQARRLLNDIASHRAHLEREAGHPIPEVVASNRWLAEVYDPVVEAIPTHLRGRMDEVEIFLEVLDHRWYMSERSAKDVGTMPAALDYFETILPNLPDLT